MPHTSTQVRKPRAFAPLISLTATLLALALGLTACGGSSSTTTTQTSANAAATGASGSGAPSSGRTSPNGTSTTGTAPTGAPPGGRPNPGRFTAVRECLAKKGITLPRRTPGEPFGGGQLPKGVSRTQLQEALKSCGGGFAGSRLRGGPNGFRDPLGNPRFHQALVRFSTCLRQNGVNVGEPNTSGKGPIFNTKGINTGSPQFRAASVKCRSALVGALRPKASPGAAGAGAGASS